MRFPFDGDKRLKDAGSVNVLRPLEQGLVELLWQARELLQYLRARPGQPQTTAGLGINQLQGETLGIIGDIALQDKIVTIDDTEEIIAVDQHAVSQCGQLIGRQRLRGTRWHTLPIASIAIKYPIICWS